MGQMSKGNRMALVVLGHNRGAGWHGEGRLLMCVAHGRQTAVGDVPVTFLLALSWCH
jgi:hypothetical protein